LIFDDWVDIAEIIHFWRADSHKLQSHLFGLANTPMPDSFSRRFAALPEGR
jgi:hypothetical protein